jgi:hypothetical protein
LVLVQRLVVSIASLAAFASVAKAQQVHSSLSLAGGLATDSRGVTSRALTVVPAVVLLPDPRIAFVVDGSGTRFGDSAWSASAETRLVSRVPVAAHLAIGVDAAATGVWSSYDFSYRVASAAPLLEAYAGPLTVGAGVRGSAAQITTVVRQGVPASIVGGPATTRDVSASVSRTGVGALLTASLRALGTPGRTLTLGVRDELDTHALLGSATLSLAMTPYASLDIGGGAYTDNRLLGTSGGNYLSVGVSLRTARRSAPPPQPAGVAPVPDGMTRIVVPSNRATSVEIAGDFTNWKPIATHRAPNGVWYVDLRIPPGQYRYACRIDGGPWRAPEGAPTVDDDFGGKAAWLVVAPRVATSGGTR